MKSGEPNEFNSKTGAPNGPNASNNAGEGRSQDASAETFEAGEADQSGPTLASSQSTIEQKVADLEAQLKEKEAKQLYLYAEFENAKKRMTKERSDLIKFGWEHIARDLLQVLDNLERAMAHTPEGTDKNLVQGLNMVIQQFSSTLKKQGVEEVKAVGKPFDPHQEEALGQMPSDQPEGTVTQEIQKGYTLHGRLLRPARVMVSSGQAASAT